MTDNKLVKDYLRDWLPKHCDRHKAAHPSYPGLESLEYKRLYADWFDELKRNNIDGDEAEAASLALLNHAEAAFRNNHLRVVTDLVEGIRRAKLEGGRDIVAKDREAAEAMSRSCIHCEGSGLAYRARLDGQPWQLTTRVGRAFEAPTIVMACTCPIGRWLLASHGDKPPWPDLTKYQSRTVNPKDAVAGPTLVVVDDAPAF